LPATVVISIIIPTLNEEDALPASLAALKRQAVEHEVIVVDGTKIRLFSSVDEVVDPFSPCGFTEAAYSNSTKIGQNDHKNP